MAYKTHECMGRTTVSAGHTKGKKKQNKKTNGIA